MGVDDIPTSLLVSFIQQHQQRLTELQNELIIRVQLQSHDKKREGAEYEHE
jgi:hypothetical protein